MLDIPPNQSDGQSYPSVRGMQADCEIYLWQSGSGRARLMTPRYSDILTARSES